MAYRSLRKFKQQQREYEFMQDRAADAHLEPVEAANDDDWERDYSEWSADRRDREIEFWGVGR